MEANEPCTCNFVVSFLLVAACLILKNMPLHRFSSPLPVHSSLNLLWPVTRKTCTTCAGVHDTNSSSLSPLWKSYQSLHQLPTNRVPGTLLQPVPLKIWKMFLILLVLVFFSAAIVATSSRSQPFFLDLMQTTLASSQWETFCTFA